jgi:hypothetical protein
VARPHRTRAGSTRCCATSGSSPASAARGRTRSSGRRNSRPTRSQPGPRRGLERLTTAIRTRWTVASAPLLARHESLPSTTSSANRAAVWTPCASAKGAHDLLLPHVSDGWTC